MASEMTYGQKYSNSWALLIGINNYQFASPLAYAVNDASQVDKVLREKFGFPDANVILLTDGSATKDNVMSEYLAFTSEKVEPNDRIIFFFAGHGYTRSGRRGEIGYLIPTDGEPDKLETLIRWDDLTRNADLIPAKHVLFVMDACYGGLAVNRSLSPGTMRFVKNMLQRYTRQVLTAGKADEVVADSGGPRQGHSVFTGHFLDALDGSAVSSDGILTANGVMAYVYDRVARDAYANQTPHYGFLDGDGDLVFVPLSFDEPAEVSLTGNEDILVEISSTAYLEQSIELQTKSIEDKVKELLSDGRYRIKLHDLVNAEIQGVLSLLGDDLFPLQQSNVSAEEFSDRLKRYEESLQNLMKTIVLISHWGTEEQGNLLRNVFARIADAYSQHSGNSLWLGLRWYPVMLLMYSGGIAALHAENYENLRAIFEAPVGNAYSPGHSQPVIIPTVEGILQVERSDGFKLLHGHERYFVPKSEYLFKTLQPFMEDLLFLGTRYEMLFDRFEVFFALVYADQDHEDTQHVWGPPGRFAWKYKRNKMFKNDPFRSLLSEASLEESIWKPLQAGLFRRSYERFKNISTSYKDDLLDQLRWY